MKNSKTKQLTMESFEENIALYIDELRNKKLNKLYKKIICIIILCNNFENQIKGFLCKILEMK